MTAATAETAANKALILPKDIAHSRRLATDKSYAGFFAIVTCTWITSWRYTPFVENDYKNDTNNPTTISISPELVDNSTAHKIFADNSTTAHKTAELVSFYWGKCLTFDAITFNVGSLDANYQSCGPIVVCANIVFSVALIIYGLASMRTGHISYKQMLYFARPLWGFLFFYRFLMYLPNQSEIMPLIPFDKKIIYWLIPEMIVIVIWIAKDSPKEGDKYSSEAKIKFHKFMGYVALIGITLFISLEILILKTTAHIYQLGWDNPLFYIIAGGSFYVGLTCFYFALMVIACATGLSFEDEETSLKNLYRAICIVGRYHFGTACCHATLIIPRLRAVFLLNEPEFRNMPETKATRRFYLMHCKIFNVLPISTALGGYKFSESVRKLLRLFHDDSSKLEQFQGFSAMCKSFLALIIGANSLMLTLLWINGAILDSRFTMGTWTMYLVVMFFNYIFMRAHDAAADSIWLYVKNEDEIKF